MANEQLLNDVLEKVRAAYTILNVGIEEVRAEEKRLAQKETELNNQASVQASREKDLNKREMKVKEVESVVELERGAKEILADVKDRQKKLQAAEEKYDAKLQGENDRIAKDKAKNLQKESDLTAAWEELVAAQNALAVEKETYKAEVIKNLQGTIV